VWARIASAPDLPAVAFTSDLSRPGFVRMGFLPVTRLALWHRPKDGGRPPHRPRATSEGLKAQAVSSGRLAMVRTWLRDLLDL
jgi:hypothetical protein